jgi:hypothetical protein
MVVQAVAAGLLVIKVLELVVVVILQPKAHLKETMAPAVAQPTRVAAVVVAQVELEVLVPPMVEMVGREPLQVLVVHLLLMLAAVVVVPVVQAAQAELVAVAMVAHHQPMQQQEP